MAKSASLGGSSVFRYREYLLLLARSRIDPALRGKLDPSDIVHDALLKAIAAIDQYRGETEQQLAAWLRTILIRTLSNALRALGRHEDLAAVSLDAALEQSSQRLAALLEDSQLSPREVASQNEQLLRLANALGQLPEDQRSVLELKYLHGCSVAEICEQTGRSKPSVAGLLFRGMRELRARLDDPAEETGR